MGAFCGARALWPMATPTRSPAGFVGEHHVPARQGSGPSPRGRSRDGAVRARPPTAVELPIRELHIEIDERCSDRPATVDDDVRPHDEDARVRCEVDRQGHDVRGFPCGAGTAGRVGSRALREGGRRGRCRDEARQDGVHRRRWGRPVLCNNASSADFALPSSASLKDCPRSAASG
jgi:hypothetical protein